MRGTAMVVGAGQGIGKSVALRLAQEGRLVYLVGRTRSKLEQVAAEISAAGGEAGIVALDVTDAAAVSRLQDVASSLDVFVHCAGESLMRTFEGTTLEEWRRTIDVNLTGAFLSTQAVLPSIRRSSNPTIVLVSSKTALKGYPVVAYSAAKAGVLGLARSLSAELAVERIRVVPVCPGPVDTPMRWASTPDMDPGVVMPAEAVADTVSYVAGLPRGVTVDTVLVQAEQYD